MNSQEIQEAINEVTASLDSRLNLLDVQAGPIIGTQCTLTGRVLAEKTRTDLLRTLSARFPNLTFESEKIQVLRDGPAHCLTVSTNLAGVHRYPSRSSELMTELFNGAVVEHLADDATWRLVRQQDGYLGYVQGAYLSPEQSSSAPTHLVSAPVTLLRAEPEPEAMIVSRAFAGTAVSLSDSTAGWARLELVGGHAGWVPLGALRALDNLPQTAEEKRGQMVSDGVPYTGVPYRWGGCSIYGIDCSGLVKLLHRLVGIELPRDADMQFAAGKAVEPPFQVGDLLYFGSGSGHRKITHVGMSLGGWDMIHSSGPRNGVYEDNVQEAPWLRDTFAGANRFLGGD